MNTAYTKMPRIIICLFMAVFLTGSPAAAAIFYLPPSCSASCCLSAPAAHSAAHTLSVRPDPSFSANLEDCPCNISSPPPAWGQASLNLSRCFPQFPHVAGSAIHTETMIKPRCQPPTTLAGGFADLYALPLYLVIRSFLC